MTGQLLRVLGVTLGAVVALLLLVACRRPLGRLCRLAARAGVGLGVLAAVQTVGGAIGLQLGVNLWNALVLAVLGLPGFGLLMMLNWLTAL